MYGILKLAQSRMLDASLKLYSIFKHLKQHNIKIK